MAYIKKPIFLITLIIASSFILNSTASAKKKGWLGINITSVNEDVKDDWDLSVDKGVLVTYVMNDGPADEAGIKKGDVILKYEGRSVKYTDELIEYIRKTPLGEKVKIEIDRDGKSKKFEVKLERYKNRVVINSFGGNSHGFSFYTKDDDEGFLGVDMYDLTDGLREYFDVEEDEGVLVVNVIDESPAEKAGFKSGDVIVKVDKRVIEDSDDLRKAISRHEPEESVKIEYVRNKKRKSKTVTLGEREDFDDHNIRIFRNKRFAPGGNSFFNFDGLENIHIDIENFEKEISINLDKNMKKLNKEIIEMKERLKTIQIII